MGYKEFPEEELRRSATFTRNIAGKDQTISLDLELKCVPGGGKPFIKISKSKESVESFSQLWRKDSTLKTIESGLLDGLSLGPLLSSPLYDCSLVLHSATLGRGTKESFVVAGSASLVKQLLGEV